MRAPSGQMTGPELRALLEDRAVAGGWVLDPHGSSVRPKARSMILVPVNGVFLEPSRHDTVPADSEVSGALMVAADSVDTGIARRDSRCARLSSSTAATIRTSPSPRTVSAPRGQGVAMTSTVTIHARVRAAVSALGVW